MTSVIKPGWSKPSTILFAAEIPTNEKAYSFALAQAAEFGAEIILFHAYNSPSGAAAQSSGIRHYDYAADRAEKRRLEPLVRRAEELGLHTKIVVRPGAAAGQILNFLHEHRVDRVIMGAHSPGPIGKLLVGSVAEAVLRNANVPVCIVGPEVVETAYRNFVNRNILCDVSTPGACHVLASFGAELAYKSHASLILQHVIRPHECSQVLEGRTLGQMETELSSLVPLRLQGKIGVRTHVLLGDPMEELLYRSRAQQANLIVLGARCTSHFATITRADTVCKVLAFAQCPVVTLSPGVLTGCGAAQEKPDLSEAYMAGVF